LKKIKFISGDIENDSLICNVSDENELIENVNIVFHCAASVSFTEPLQKAVNINTAGTKRILDLAMKIENLEVFVYISTAFSHCYQTELEERHYDLKLDANLVMKQVREMNNEELKMLEIEL
jgi:alcohol-forming fatty acyl-CoA reductase